MPDLQALKLLVRWPVFAEKHFWKVPSRPELGCFGTGYNGWGVQTNQKYLGALAVLGMDENFDETAAGFAREAILERALAALRFALATHQSGDFHCTDGTRWGRTWISALGIERMMHGVELIEERLSGEDRQRLRAMLVDEADHQRNAEIVAGLWANKGENKPESNIWNGAICARAALMYPGEPHAAAWIEKAHAWWINGISVPADAADGTVLAGKPVRERHVGANFFPHYALDHHRYLNVGYMVICLSNIAMIHYAFVRRGQAAPPSLYHHAGDLWALVRRLIFADGRLCRIGGDTRQRYCYCQDYLLPALVFAADHLQDEHAMGLLAAQLELIAREQTYNGDGGFLSHRLRHIATTNPLYYTRLESDKAVVLSMVRHWRQRIPRKSGKPARDFEASVEGGWIEPEHGAVFHRSPARMVSFAWRAAEGPMALLLPPERGQEAEWQENLSGRVRLLGDQGKKRVVECRKIDTFPGGFLTAGRLAGPAQRFIPEGLRLPEESWLRQQLVFAALPDGHTAVRLEHAAIPERRVYIEALEGVKWEIPNDLFNGKKRRYSGAKGARVLSAHEGETECIALDSSWVNVDDRLGAIGVYGAEGWALVRRGRRIGGYAGSILTDALCYPGRIGLWAENGPAVLLDSACVLIASVDAQRTQAAHEAGMGRRLDCGASGRAVEVQGLDGRAYLVAANFSKEKATLEIARAGVWTNLANGEPHTGKGALRIALDAGEACVLVRKV